MFGNKRVRELEATVDGFGARLAEAEARIAGLVKLAGANEQLDQRFASAIDEIERRQTNGLHTVNAAFTGLSKRVEALAAEQEAAPGSSKPSQVPTPGAAPAASPSDPQPTSDPQPSVAGPSLAAIDGALVRGAPIPEPAE